MTNNFDNTSFYLDQAGLELSLSDFAFDATQASQVQQHLQQQQQQQQLLHQQHQHQQRQQKQQHQQEQQKLQNLLLRDDPSQNLHSSENQSSNNNNQQHDTSNPVVTTSSGPYDFRPAAMTMEMMNPTGTGSASTTPVFQTHPDKVNNTSNNTNNGTRSAASLQQLQQQHQQQQLLLQQQQQRQQQQLRQQQQHQLQQLPQTQAQLQAQAQAQTHAQQAHHQHKDGGAAVRQNLLKPTGSDYYAAAAADYSQYQYMSPMGIQPDNSVEAAMTMPEQFDEEAADSTEQLRPMSFIQGTPMLSPELTPANPYPNLPQSMSSGDGFTPLTSPAIGPHRNSQMDYISFTNGQGFSALPMQFQQAHQIQQQQLQNFQAQQQQQFLSSDIQQQQQQVHQGIGTKHARDVANGQRPGLKRRPTVEHSAANGVGSRTAASTPVTAATVAAAANATANIVGGGGPIRLMSKSSPALGPLTSTPLTQAGVRKPVVSASASRTSRPSSLVPAPASPMGMHFSGGNHRITPSPIMTSTINGTPQPQSQPSPSPHLVGGMNQLSMMPASPAMFSLPASSMMPPPMTLPQQQTQSHIQTHRQLQISQPVHMQQQQQQYQLSIHPPQQLQQQQHNHFAPIGSMLRPAGSAAPLAPATIASAPMPIAATTTPTMGASVDTAMGQSQNTASPSLTGTLTPKFALAPVTPASLMKLSGAGSGSESTPTSSPKSTFNNINTNAALAPTNSNNIGNPSSSSPSATAPTTTTTAKSTRSIAAKSTEKSKAPAGGSGSSSRSSSGGSKRSGGGSSKNKGSTNAGVLAPRTPGTTATTVISAMPAGGFATLISPALKPTLMPQPPLHHRGSLTGQQILVSTSRGQSLLVSPSLKPWLPGVSTTEAMARLASKSNYQNILDGDHTALGLSYNTDLHSGIELRRTSHKAAEQKRRDSLKHCFDDLRHMIPNIVDKAPSKVFLLKKSFDYICSLKAEMAQRDLTIARMQAQQEYFQQACRQWFESDAAAGGGGVPDMEGWKMSEEMLDQATRRELEVAQMAAEIAEQSAVAVEAARIGNQPGGGGSGSNKDGRKAAVGVASTQANGSTSSSSSSTSQQQRQNASSKDGSDDDEDDDSTPTASRRSSTIAANMMSSSSSMAPSSTSSSASSTSTSTPTIHPLSGASPLDIQMTSAFTSTSNSSSSISAAQKQRTQSRSSRSDDEDEEDDDEDDDDDDEEDYDGDQEMRSVL